MGPSRLVDEFAPLILDASSVLNLLGSGRARDILTVLRRQALITAQAAGEVGRDPLTGAPGSDVLEELAGDGLFRTVRLSDNAYEVFLGFVSAPSPEGLDDGEAATVAHAAEVHGVPIIDERKGTRIAATFCAHPPLCTLDVFASVRVHDALGTAGLADAVHSALLRARMRVPDPFRDWVLGLLSPDQLRACPSIPRSWLRTPATGVATGPPDWPAGKL